MRNDYYQFNLGRFECTAVSDGGHDYPIKNMFSNVPEEQVKIILQEHGLPVDHLHTPYTCLHLNTGLNSVLVDMGGGNVMPKAGKLIPNMIASGINPNQIDTIIITHAHPDHIGGMLADDERLAFPNAQCYIWQKEWDFWMSENAAGRAPQRHVSLAQNRLPILKDALTFVEPNKEIVPGISGIAASGHTPGHMALSIISDGMQLIHVSDTVLYPYHLDHPDWLPVYDIDPDEAEKSKRKIFNLAADQKAMVFAHHFPPFPNLGFVTKNGKGWKWQPIQTHTGGSI